LGEDWLRRNAFLHGLPKLSRVSSGVCDLERELGKGRMCGAVFTYPGGLRKHLSTVHSCFVASEDWRRADEHEGLRGENALKQWVLHRGWRDAEYASEPGRGPLNGLIDHYATSCETFAKKDPYFAAVYSEVFHRPIIDPSSARSRTSNEVGQAHRT
jgi:hypothetical protein